MKKISLLFVSIILIFSFCNTTEDNDDTNKTLETELDSVSYSLGTFNAIELQKQNKQYALVTMCIGVGQGYATIIEKV